MKKIILLSLLLTTFAFGEAKLYMGTGYAYSNAQTDLANSSVEQTTGADTVRIKAGYGEREAYAVEFSLDYIDSDPKKYAFDISLIKAFDWDIYINPFVKAGFGAGMLEKLENEEHSLTYGSFHIGTGVFIPLGENVDIELSYEFKKRSFEKVDTADSTESRTSTVNFMYIGANFRF